MTIVSEVLFYDIGKVKANYEDIELSPLKDNEVRISPAYIGICGSDLHVLAGKHPFAKPPVVSGHEISAIVTEVGKKVTNTKVGDHVVVDPIMACMECRACKMGRFNLCEPPMVAGFRAPGFARSTHVVPARNIHVASSSIPLDVLAFTEPATCACHCVNRVPKENLEKVLVIGAGTIGLSIVQALHINGVNDISVIEPDEYKRSLAKEFGAKRILKPGELGDDKFTAIIDVVASQSTITESCSKIIAGGTVVCMGVPLGSVEIPLASMQRFERDLISSGMYIPSDFDQVLKWLEQGLFKTEKLVTKVFPIKDADKAFEEAKKPNSIKILIKFN